MHFKQPEILFALVFLLIPLLVHLFQLRKYQKEDFTNVKFLKKISRETRKSSRLKKWLVLLTRMFALGSIIIAFAQPYLPAKEQNRANLEKVIYVDNSFSMQAIGKTGELLNTAIQDLLKNIPEEGNFHFITNDEEHTDLNPEELKTRLEQTDFSSKSLSFQSIELKATQFSEVEIPPEIILLSDFQKHMDLPENFDSNYHLVPFIAENNINYNLDSLYIEKRDPEFLYLNFILKSNRKNSDQVTVSAFDGEKLLARKTLNFEGENRIDGNFQLRNEQVATGSLEIEDNGLQYDNNLYFSINPAKEISGAVISRDISEAGFLNRIFTEPEFDFNNFTPESIDFNLLSKASFIILNELENLSSSLRLTLEKMHSAGKTIAIIPSEENTAVNSFLGSLPASGYGNLKSQELLITNIAYEHPLLNGVFENEITNFDYPRVEKYYSLTGGNKVLGFQDNTAFLSEQENLYLFAAPLNSKNSNFKNAPLVVPVFYNLGRTALALPQLYYQVNRVNQIEVPVESSGDEVVSLVSENENFIPVQQAFTGKVRLNNQELPETAGHFSIFYKGEERGKISYNYLREESSWLYREDFNNAQMYNSVSEYFNNVRSATQNKALWKWFVILALIFLTAEMLLLKYLK